MNITMCTRDKQTDPAKAKRDKDIADLAERARLELFGLIDSNKITDVLIRYLTAARGIK